MFATAVIAQLKIARSRWLALLLAAMLTACAGSIGTSSTAGQWPTSASIAPDKAGFSSQGLAALDAKMKSAVDKKEVSGVVWFLARHGQVAGFKAHGVQDFDSGAPMRIDSLFRIYSMTKPVTGVAMMQLYEKGLWKLDDPVTRFIPEFANLKVYKGKDANGNLILVDASRPATMRELLTHTAGFGYGLSAGNPVDDAFRADPPLAKPNFQAMIDTIAKLPLVAHPGERWSYSIATDIQGAIVERLSGERYEDYLRNHIFKPLRMSETQFFLEEKDRPRLPHVYQWDRASSKLAVLPDDRGRSFFHADHVESGGGGLISTTHDYARFAQMLLNKGEFDGARILKPETVDLMAQNHIGELRIFSDGNRPTTTGQAGIGFGLNVAVVTDAAAARSQQAVGSYYWFGIAGTWFWIDPKNDLFFVGMIQRRGGAGQGAVNFRTDSIKLAYDALQSKSP